MIRQRIYLFAVFFFALKLACAQSGGEPYDSLVVDYGAPKEYTIAGIKVTGTEFLDKDILIAISGIHVGDRIELPSLEASRALKNLWKQELFANVRIYIDSTDGDKAYLNYVVEERPRLSGFTFRGTTKSEENDLRDKIKLNRGKVLTDNVKVNTISTIRSFYAEKGYQNCDVNVKEVPDSTQKNSMLYYIYVDKGNRVKIDNIDFTGNVQVKTSKLHSLMKKTKENSMSPLSIFSLSRFQQKEYDADKAKIIEYYGTKGFRDARIISDSIYRNEKGNLNILINLAEGNKYYYRSINWVGNSKYSSPRLDSVLRIKKGDVYDEAQLQKRLSGDPRGDDVGSLYMDDGYLFFGVTPVEVGIQGDSVDIELRMHEGASHY